MSNTKTPLEVAAIIEADDKLKLEARKHSEQKMSAEYNWYWGARSEAARDYWQQQNRVDVRELEKRFFEFWDDNNKKTISNKDVFNFFLPHLQQPQGNGWISVEQQSPEQHQYVLCFGKGNRMFTGMFNGKKTFLCYDHHDGICAADFVTHWQPLPQPPKQKEGEGE
jgi:hypothetical protein